MVGFLSTCEHSTSSSTMRHVTIYYTPCRHPPNHIFMSWIDFLWLVACISHRKILADDSRMIHYQQNNMLSYIMSLQTNIAMVWLKCKKKRCFVGRAGARTDMGSARGRAFVRKRYVPLLFFYCFFLYILSFIFSVNCHQHSLWCLSFFFIFFFRYF
jgi:hypothetical protein